MSISASSALKEDSPATTDLDAEVRKWGYKIFSLVERGEPPALFTSKGLHAALMQWAMRDEEFKTQLFRFVDVLPTLSSSREISRHLKEYLDNDQVKLSTSLRAALKTAGGLPWLFGPGVKGQVTALARQFMLVDDPKEIIAVLHARAWSEQHRPGPQGPESPETRGRGRVDSPSRVGGRLRI